MDELVFLPAFELARRIRRRDLSALDLLDTLLARIARLGSTINALPVLDAERARHRARQADLALARGELWGPLHGVPMTVKESFRPSSGRPVLRPTTTATRRGTFAATPAATANGPSLTSAGPDCASNGRRFLSSTIC